MGGGGRQRLRRLAALCCVVVAAVLACAVAGRVPLPAESAGLPPSVSSQGSAAPDGARLDDDNRTSTSIDGVTKTPASDGTADGDTRGSESGRRGEEMPLAEPDQAVDVSPEGEGAPGDDDETGSVPAETPGTTMDEQDLFVMPDGADYEDGVVLVSLPDDVSAEDAAAYLADACLNTVEAASAEAVTDDVAYVRVAADHSVEQAVNELERSGKVQDVQPNYRYTVDEALGPADFYDLLGYLDVRRLAGSAVPMVYAEAETASVEDESLDEPSGESEADSLDEPGGASKDEPNVEPDDEPDGAFDDPVGVSEEPTLSDDDPDSVPVMAAGEDEVLPLDSADGESLRDATESGSSDAADPAPAASGQSLLDVIDDAQASRLWSLNSMNVWQAWAEGARASEADPPVGVALIDSGFLLSHEDLRNNVAPGSAFNAYRASTGETDEQLLADVVPGPYWSASYDHGTHVAGIVAAEANNGVGVAGVSYNAQLVPIRAYNYEAEAGSAGAFSKELVCAFEHVLEVKDTYNMRVVNLSMGYATKNVQAADRLLTAAIDKVCAADIVVVASAGNNVGRKVGDTTYEGAYHNYPSDLPNVVGVIGLSNTSSADPYAVERVGSSNYNMDADDTKRISAPGGNIYSTVAVRDSDTGFADATRTSLYGAKTGTSMAAPQVSGALALLFATDPDLTADEAVQTLYASARKFWDGDDFSLEYGYGEVDAWKAVQLLGDGAVEGPAYLVAGEDGVAYGTTRGTGWEFSSSDAGVLDVAADGTTRAAGVGSAEVVATRTVDGRTVTLRKQVYVVGGITGPSQVVAGQSVRMEIDAPESLAWSWSSGNEAVVTVTDDGVVTAGSQTGTVSVTAELAAARGSGHPVRVSCDVTVTAPPKPADSQPSQQTAGGGQGTRTPEPASPVSLSAARITLRRGATKPKPTVRLGGVTLKQGRDYTCSYRTVGGTIIVTVRGKGSYTGTRTAKVAVPKAAVRYRADCIGVPWQGWRKSGKTAGSTKAGFPLEGLRIRLKDAPYGGSVQARARVAGKGWTAWRKAGKTAGTSGKGRRMQAVRIRLTKQMAKHYDVWYRVYNKRYGWMGWAKNGKPAGGLSSKNTALQVRVLPKGSAAPGSTKGAYH